MPNVELTTQNCLFFTHPASLSGTSNLQQGLASAGFINLVFKADLPVVAGAPPTIRQLITAILQPQPQRRPSPRQVNKQYTYYLGQVLHGIWHLHV